MIYTRGDAMCEVLRFCPLLFRMCEVRPQTIHPIFHTFEPVSMLLILLCEELALTFNVTMGCLNGSRLCTLIRYALRERTQS